jgi:hypothetical protein
MNESKRLPLKRSRIWAAVIFGGAICAGAIVAAAVPHTFMTNDTLAAADLNGNFMALDQRLAALETTLAVTAWTPVPIATNAPIEVYPDSRWGSGLEYKNVGPMTCLDGLLKADSANFTGTIATLPTGARPHVWLNVLAATDSGQIQLQIQSTGVIGFNGNFPAGGWVSFGGICFPNQ